jgi:hypothetical protein
LGIASAIFMSMPQPKNENRLPSDFVAHFVGPHDQSPNFARRKFFQQFAAARVFP